VISKWRILVVLALFVVSFSLLHQGDEPSDSEDRDGESESATERSMQPPQPAFLQPKHDYGIAGKSDAAGQSDGVRRLPETESYPGGYGIANQYGRDGNDMEGGYRFRPLSDRERKRSQQSGPYAQRHPDEYSATYDAPLPWYQYSGTELQGRDPDRHAAPPGYSDDRSDAYSFRPLSKSPVARGHRQGEPYWNRGDGFEGHPSDTWTAPPHPQWGSQPSEQPLYPSLRGEEWNSQFTAR
jgi:hypothetical protein